MKGYEYAEKIDKQIGDVLKHNPITEENAMEWIAFARTIRSGLEIVEEKAKDVLDAYTEKIASQNA